MNHKDYRHLLACAATLLLLLGCAESEKITEEPHPGDVQPISFSIDLTQDWYAQKPSTRAILERSQPRHIDMQCSDGSTAYLLETTRTGIEAPLSAVQAIENMSADEIETRASLVNTSSSMGDFSSFCYKGSDGSALYSNEQTSNTGALSTKKYWPDTETSLSFYSVHPYDGTAAHFTAPAGGDGLKYTSFTVDANPENHVDLMYASTGAVSHNSSTPKQYIPLYFKHALTAVRFKLGTAPNFGKTIKSISLKNVYTAGTLTLPTTSTDETTNASASWTPTGGKTGTVTLDNISFAADNASLANNVITKGGKTEYFLMIPQDLTGVVIEVVFTDNTTFSATLSSGSWTAGTTVDYSLSNEKDNWNYTFTMTSPSAVASTGTSATYGILSYRTQKSNSSNQVAVPWKIVSYEVDEGDGNGYGSPTTTLPSWLTALSLERGDGGTTTQSGTATLRTNLDKENNADKTTRDNGLKTATPKSDYDLSQGGETANCYVVSAPGTYKIPLIYGNMRNSSGEKDLTCLGNTSTLQATFVDAAGTNLYTQNKMEIQGVTSSTQGGLVWTDCPEGVVSDFSVNTSDNTLDFTVNAAQLESGNAVVGIYNMNGANKEYLWSWHLWFAPASVLSTIDCTNAASQVQKFTTEALGYKPWTQKVSTNSSARKVRLNLLQKESGRPAQIVITQNAGTGTRTEATTTLYQFGRKDAFSGSSTGAPSIVSGNQSYATTIMNPGTFYTYTSSNFLTSNYNGWSANNSGTSSSSPTYDVDSNNKGVVKTVYDPCPAGFKMPGANAFTGFGIGTISAGSSGTPNASNQSPSNTFTTDKGWYFYTSWRSSASDPVPSSTIFFPAAGCRSYSFGALSNVGSDGYYWSVVPYGTNYGWILYFGSSYVYPQIYNSRAFGYSVRPVSEYSE